MFFPCQNSSVTCIRPKDSNEYVQSLQSQASSCNQDTCFKFTSVTKPACSCTLHYGITIILSSSATRTQIKDQTIV